MRKKVFKFEITEDVNTISNKPSLKKFQNNKIYNILKEFHTNESLFKKYQDFNQIIKKYENNFYSSPLELAKDIRNIFSALFYSSLEKLDTEEYSQLLNFSQFFENIFEKNYKTSQVKIAIQLTEELCKLKKLEKVKRNTKNMKLNTQINLEKNEDIKKDIRRKINKINCEQKKGILNIISETLINKNNDIIEFDINKLPLDQLMKLDKYINECIGNIIISNKMKKQDKEKENNSKKMDELMISEDSDYTESIEIE